MDIEGRLAVRGVGIPENSNVLVAGAKGDGTTDDSTAIQDAINSVTGWAAGGTVVLPSGDFRVLSTIVLKTGVRLVGAGQLATRIINNTNSNPIIAVGDSSDAGGPADQASIEDLKIEGNATTTEGVGVKGPVDDNSNWANASRFFRMLKVWIDGVGAGPGLRVSSWNGVYDQVKIESCQYGLEIGHEFNSNLFLGLNISSCDDYAITVTPSISPTTNTPTGSQFVRTTVQLHQHASNAAIQLHYADTFLFDGLWLESNEPNGSTINVNIESTCYNTAFRNVNVDGSDGETGLRVFYVAGDHFSLDGCRIALTACKYVVEFNGASVYRADVRGIKFTHTWDDGNVVAAVHDSTTNGQVKWLTGDTNNLIRNSSLVVQEDAGPWNDPSNADYIGTLFEVGNVDSGNGGGGTAPTINVSIDSSTVPNTRHPNSLKLEITNVGVTHADRRWRLIQTITDPEPYLGMTISMSITVKASTTISLGNGALQIGDDSATTSNPISSIGTTWTTYSITHTVDTGTSEILAMFTLDAGGGEFGDTGDIYVAGWSMMVGDVAVWPEVRPTTEETRLVHQLYWRLVPGATDKFICGGSCWNTSIFHGMFFFEPMRAAPTVTFSANDHFKIVDGGGEHANTSNGQGDSIQNGYARFRLDDDDTGLTQYRPAWMATANAAAYIELDARL